MQITIGLLEDHGVCENQRQVFATEWPKGCTVTLAVARRAAELGLDLEWAANNLLCAQARSQFVEAVAPARRVYDEKRACAFVAACDLHDSKEH